MDPLGLGHWVWFALSAQMGITTCIISAYQPSDSPLIQTNSVHAQHQSYHLSQGDPCPPQAAFLHNLGTAISTCQMDGDQIILMANMNGDF